MTKTKEYARLADEAHDAGDWETAKYYNKLSQSAFWSACTQETPEERMYREGIEKYEAAEREERERREKYNIW